MSGNFHPQQVGVLQGDDPIEMKWEGGISKRDWFAGLALQGIMANPVLQEQWARDFQKKCDAGVAPSDAAKETEESYALRATRAADALVNFLRITETAEE